MLTAAELTSMRSQVAAALPDTVSLSRPGVTVDSEGNTVGVLAALSTPAGWLMVPGPSDRLLADQAGQTVDAVLLLPYGTDVRPGDRATVGGAAWTVATVADARLHARAGLKKAEA
ncbi:MAG: hypothetical protein IPM45_18015 [Acidimicrobiales bacterium]|nr:hypothetical protein [Acidimicrobiales bacterium]